MIKKSYLYLLPAAGLITLQGCIQRQAFLISPFNGNSLEYHPIPKAGDTIHTAVYSSLTYSNGSANQFGTDDLWSMHLSVHAAHQYDHVQFHYGFGLTLGSYDMGTWEVDTVHRGRPVFPVTALPTASQLNTYAGSHDFGGMGFQGGINSVHSFRDGEWRYLGVETSISQEFGNYLSVRKQIPDSIVTLINRRPLFATVGVTSELVVYQPQGEFGFKWALGWDLGRYHTNPNSTDNFIQEPKNYMYYNFTFHYTWRRFTSYVQYNDATKAKLIFAGINYRLWAGH